MTDKFPTVTPTRLRAAVLIWFAIQVIALLVTV